MAFGYSLSVVLSRDVIRAGPEKGVSRSVRVFVKIIVSEVSGWGEHRARSPAWPVIGPFIVISVVARGSRHLLPAERYGPRGRQG